MNEEFFSYLMIIALAMVFLFLVSLSFFVIRYIFTKKKFQILDVLFAPIEFLAYSSALLIRLFWWEIATRLLVYK